jgi:cytochrome b6-f complex iron-sulfur subunit
MSNYSVEPVDRPQALTKEALKAIRHEQVQGVSRRELLRGSLAAAVGLWLTEVAAGTVGFLWPNLSGGFGGKVVVGNLAAVGAHPANSDPAAAFADGAPAYAVNAKSYIVMLDPAEGFKPGASPQGDGAATNVRTLYQRCTHLGCKPNFCPKNYWFECPCHGSRYDRLGIKVANLGPAPRGLDRFASAVDAGGVLTIDTSKITLGPLPVALGQPGVIPPRSATGCQ